MTSHLALANIQPEPLPPEFAGDDVRFPPALVETFLKEFTRAGDIIFDPFAGFGTTLIAAEALGRIPYGVERDARRAEYIRARLRQPQNLIHGDTRQLAALNLPPLDFSITSPPYTNRADPEDPLTEYATPGRGYRAYLRDLQAIYAQLARKMKPGATVVVEVANLKKEGVVTPLAWDVAAALSRVLRFEGETVVCWDRYGYGYEHSYCLRFTAPARRGARPAPARSASP